MTLPPPRPTRLRAGCAATALLLAGPAAAEITAREVREEFEAAYERMGMTVEVGSEEAGDGAVRLSDVTFSFEFTEEGADEGAGPDEGEGEGEPPAAPPEPDRRVAVEATFPEIAFEETPEGGVRATLSPQGTMTVTGSEVGTDARDTARFALPAEGFELLVAEEPAAEDAPGGAGRRYALSADRLAARLEEATRDGEPVEATVLLALEDVATTTTVPPPAEGSEAVGSYVQSGEIAAATMRLDVPMEGEAPADGEPPAEPGRLVSIGETRDIVLSGEGAVPGEAALAALTEQDDPGPALRAGLGGRFSLSYGSSTSEGFVSDPADPEQSISVESESQGGDLEMSVDAQGLAVSGDADMVRYAMEGGGLPVPRIELALEEAEGAFRMPLLEGEAGPFELRYLLAGLTMNEEVWTLFDPEERLPRDPATLLLGVDGRLRLLADLFDEEAQARAEAAGEPPVEFEELALELRLEAVGADVEADGAFTFDPDGAPIAPGVPTPTGTLNVVATGIDGLFDTLSEMGLVPPDQLLPARMMLGLFARPDGSGGYTSEIVVDGETGSVTANGQRLR